MAGEREIAAIALLDEPVRRRLYEYVVARGEPVGREEAAGAAGISRSLAAFHLDRLVEGGLLSSELGAPRGGGGRGAGRPPKLYRRSVERYSVAIPQTRYTLAGRILAEALESMLPGEAPEAAVRRVADQEGRELGEAAMKHARGAKARDPLGAVLPPLEHLGFEPERAGGEVLLRNCPFHDLVDAHRGLVCAMNHALLSGLVAAMDRPEVAAHSREPDASCCVALTAGG